MRQRKCSIGAGGVERLRALMHSILLGALNCLSACKRILARFHRDEAPAKASEIIGERAIYIQNQTIML